MSDNQAGSEQAAPGKSDAGQEPGGSSLPLVLLLLGIMFVVVVAAMTATGGQANRLLGEVSGSLSQIEGDRSVRPPADPITPQMDQGGGGLAGNLRAHPEERNPVSYPDSGDPGKDSATGAAGRSAESLPDNQ